MIQVWQKFILYNVQKKFGNLGKSATSTSKSIQFVTWYWVPRLFKCFWCHQPLPRAELSSHLSPKRGEAIFPVCKVRCLWDHLGAQTRLEIEWFTLKNFKWILSRPQRGIDKLLNWSSVVKSYDGMIRTNDVGWQSTLRDFNQFYTRKDGNVDTFNFRLESTCAQRNPPSIWHGLSFGIACVRRKKKKCQEC